MHPLSFFKNHLGKLPCNIYSYIIKGTLLYTMLTVLGTLASAQNKEFQLPSPHSAIVTHLQNLQKDNFHPEISAETFYAPELSRKKKKRLAIMLKEIYDVKGFYINPDEIPTDNNYFDSTVHQHVYHPVAELKDIYLIKIHNNWYYSKHTVDNIKAYYQELYPAGTGTLVAWITILTKGTNGSPDLFGLYYWQYLAILIIIALTFLAHLILRYIITRVLKTTLIYVGLKILASKILLPISTPLGWFIVLRGTLLLLRVIQLPIHIGKYLYSGLEAITPIFLIIVAFRLVDFLSSYLKTITDKTEGTLDDQLVPMVRKTLKLIVIAGGVMFILQSLHFNITGLIAGISIGGVAIALAAQDTLKNLFGSFMIFLDKPFQVGDWIMGTNLDGNVEEVGFRTTRVRTFYNSLVSIPNGKIADMTIDNLGKREYRRYKTNISITYDTPPDLIEIFVEQLKEIVMKHPDTRKDYFHVYINNFSSSSLDILFYIFFKVPDWGGELKARHEIMLEVIRLANKLGVKFAFPTTTIHIEEFPEKEPISPPYPKTKEEMYAKLK